MTHGETREPTRCPDCNGRDWQPRSDGRCNECGDKADQEHKREQDRITALEKRVAELEGERKAEKRRADRYEEELLALGYEKTPALDGPEAGE